MTFEEIISKKEYRKYAGEEDLMFFSLYYFSKYHKYSLPEFHRWWYKDLNDPIVKVLMLIAYRESAKTSLAKIKIIHDIVYHKKNFIIWTSKDKKKAEGNLFDIALELQTNKRLIADFGQLFFEDNITDEKFSKKKSIGEFITKNNIKVKAYSTSQSPRGEVFGEFRPDLAILDDYENLETIDSEAYTQEVISYIDELLSGLGNTAQIISLSNRLTFGGSVSYLEDRIKNIPNCKVYDIAVLDKQGIITWKDKYVYTDEQAEAINKTIENPEKYKVSLESKQRLLGYQVYNREMLNTPMTDEEREFKPQWIQYRTRLELSAYNVRKFLVIDTAMGEKESNDFTGITEVFVDTQGFWTVSSKAYKINPNELVNLIFTMYQENGYERIGIEKTTFTEGLKPYMQQQMRERNVYLPIVELSHGGTKKETRIRALIPRYQNKSIFHLVGECYDLEEQLRNFPRCLHDDVLDSLAYTIHLLGSDPKPRQEINKTQTQFRPKGFTNRL